MDGSMGSAFSSVQFDKLTAITLALRSAVAKESCACAISKV